MPNVLDAEPIRAFARHAAKPITDENVAARFARLAFERLLGDPRNFRPASPAELALGPAWALQARARGDEISIFKLNRAAAARLRTIARRLAETCKVAAADTAARPRDLAAIAAARVFLNKFDRANFDIAARKALFFSRVLAGWELERDAEPVCPAQEIKATKGGVWARLRSVAELRAVGGEFHNCLARVTRVSSYASMLRRGLAQFWVLRDRDGAGLIVAMAPTPKEMGFSEVKGPRNAAVNREHPDLLILADALGMRPLDPPLPPTLPPSTISLARTFLYSAEETELAQTRLRLLLELSSPRRRRACS